ncbi:EAL domain-containing protein [Cellvibrio sp. OA-2007]|uniref:EAL domain-containing protein n=1 Tax=Cellvibrio sp. OA-2007 TaxID=529823 RepID=UPI000AD56A82|nr:EAL domain-containing protein [Cellvibrio sp. OA-2007]
MLFASPGEGISQPQLPRLAQLLLVFMAYSLTGWLGLCVPFESDRVTLFWLPGGIALAAFYRWSPRLWPAVFLAALLLQVYSGANLAINLLLATSNTLAPLCALWLLRRAHCNPTQLRRANTFYFLILGALGMLVSASVGGFALNYYNQGSFETGLYTALIWWMGDSLGVFLAAPLLTNINRTSIDKVLQRKLDFFIVFTVSLAVGLFCFPLNNFDNNLHLPIVFTSFVCVAWAALSFGLLGSGLTTIGFSFLAIWSTVNQLGPFALPSQQLSYWVIWIYTASMTILGLMIAAAHTEIATTTHQLGESSHEQEKQKKHLEAVLHAIPDLLFEIDRQGHVLSFNDTNQHHILSAPDVLGRNLSETLASSSVTVWMNALSEADNWGISQGKSIRISQDETTLWYELSIAKLAGAHRESDRFICLARDITKRVHTHQTDLENEQRFRNIFEATRNIAVQGYNRFHEVIFWNKASEDLYKFSAAEAMGKKLEDLIIPGFMREGVHQAIEDWHEKDEAIPSGELALKDAHGNEVWVYSNHVLIDTPDHKEMYCLDIDLGPQRKALLQAEQELVERKQVEVALRQSEQRLESAQLMARIAHWSWNPASDNYQFSSSMKELFSLPDEFLNAKMSDFINQFIYVDDRDAVTHALTESLRYHQPLALEARVEIAGQKFWLQLQGDTIADTEGTSIQGTMQDITERKGLDLALTAAAAADAASAPDFFVTILNALTHAIGAQHAVISLIDKDNPTMATTHTYLINGQVQPNINYALHNTPCSDVMEENFCFMSTGAQKRYPHDEILRDYNIDSYLGVGIKNAQGAAIGILVLMAEHPLPISAQINSLLLIFADRIGGELRRAQDQEKIFNLAFFDPLTHLLNRRMLQDRLKLLTAQSARTHQHGALLFIDIDHFKLLNDTRGHHIGDQLLVQVGERISSIIRATDLAARLGGDEFVVVFDNLGDNAEMAAQEAKKRAEELHDLINLPYPLQQSVFHCTISIGVNLFKGQTRSIDDLLRHADVAMYQAKDSGRNAIRFFDPNMQSHLEKRAAIEADLRTAYESQQQLIPYYQVQINSQGKALGAELLLRWKHPVNGMISPADFIPVAEQTGLIIAIGRHVIRQACEQLRQWSQHPQFASLSIAVNVSPIQFNQAQFVEEVLDIVKNSNIKPRLLKLELTESSLLKNVDQSIEKMQQLQDNGIGFSMDDFGIGYSSLSYLKRLPLDQLKIDQTFVRDIAIDPNDAIIARTIIAMAQNMNLQVIAEGVETEAQKTFLEQNGCSMFQGYYFGRPVAVAEFEQQLIERKYC